MSNKFDSVSIWEDLGRNSKENDVRYPDLLFLFIMKHFLM